MRLGRRGFSSVDRHTFFALTSEQVVKERDARRVHLQIIDVHQESSTDAGRMTIVYTDAEKNGDGCVHGRSTEIQNTSREES